MKREEFLKQLNQKLLVRELELADGPDETLRVSSEFAPKLGACQTIGELFGLLCTEGFDVVYVIRQILEIVIEDPLDNEFDGLQGKEMA